MFRCALRNARDWTCDLQGAEMLGNRVLWLAVAGTLQLALLQRAAAQASDESASASAGIEEVVVTARRREENLQTVPTAVSALGSQELADLQINNFGAVGLTVPNLSVQTHFGTGSVGQQARP